MKQVLFFMLCLIVSGGCGRDVFISESLSASDKEAERQECKVYPFKSAIITYTFDGGRNATDGTRTVYIDQWGKRQAEKIYRNLANDDEIIEWIIIHDHVRYFVELENNTASKFILTERKADGIDLDALTREKGGYQQALEDLKNRGILILHNENFAGYSCQVIDQKLTNVLHEKRWVYKGIALKKLQYLSMSTEHVEGLIEQATSVAFDVPVNRNVFELPAGVEVLP